jgi:serine protease AprX
MRVRNTHVRALILLLISCPIVWGGKKVAPDLQKLSDNLLNLAPNTTINIIISFSVPPTQDMLNQIVGKGANPQLVFNNTQAASATVHAKDLLQLTTVPIIVSISLDHDMQPNLDSAAAAIHADIAWKFGYDGAGVGVAVIDSGIVGDSHDLHGNNAQNKDYKRIVYAESFVAGADEKDHYGHGTEVAGIIAGDGSQSNGTKYFKTFVGIAPGAQLISLKVLDNNGQGKESDVIQGIERAIQLKDQYNIRVINLSLGHPVSESSATDPLCKAVEAAWKAGIVVVVAAGNGGRDNSAGNQGYATITSPGNSPYVITVGAMNTRGTPSISDDVIASYSSKGPTVLDHVVKPDLVAPGNRIGALALGDGWLAKTYPANLIPESAYKTGGGNDGKTYMRLSGTSMAAPMVSGAVALLLEKEPQLTPDQVKAILMKTANKQFPTSSAVTDPVTGQTFTSRYDIFTIGAGYVDVEAALNSTDVPPSALGAQSPVAVFNSSTGTVTISSSYSDVCGSSAVWGDSAVWGSALCGSSAVWGDSAVWGSSAVWGDSAVWGSSVLLSGSSAVWGDSAVWGSSTLAGFSAVWGSSAVWGDSAVWGSGTVDALSTLIQGDN